VRGGFGIFEDRSRQLINNNTTSNPPVAYTPTAYYGNLNTLSQASGYIGPSTVTFIAPIAGTQMPAVMCIADTRQNPSWTCDAATIPATRSVMFTSSCRFFVSNQR
jgi:hypothetical protein